MGDHIKRLFVFIVLFASFALNSYSSARITSFTMNPPSPTFGQAVTVHIEYCARLYGDMQMAIAVSSQSTRQNAALSGIGQVFIVSEAGFDVPTSRPASTQGGAIDWLANTENGWLAAPPCTECSGQDGQRYVKDWVLHIPSADNFPGCDITDLYMHLKFRENNMNEGDWHTDPADNCFADTISWEMPLLPSDFEIRKRVEGVIQDPNDLVLFSVDYSYANGPLTINDSIPASWGGNLELVSFGPASITGGSVTGPPSGATSGSFNWTFPDRTGLKGKAEGTVWMLYRLASPVPLGTSFTNVVTGNMLDMFRADDATIITGQAAIDIEKMQSEDLLYPGDTITYTLEYNINGSKLIAYQPFDEISGTYSSSAPPGWTFMPEASTNGVWTVSDVCGTGDRIITGSVPYQAYPGMLYTGNTFCEGTIITDALIDPGPPGAAYEGSDALVIIRNNGLAGNLNSAYALGISIDDNFGDNPDGNVGFQKCTAGGCSWPSSVDNIQIVGNKWYRVKIDVQGATFRAKVWAKGDPEPTAYTIVWTDPNAAADGMTCSQGDPWYAGVGEQGGANGTTQDSYNNFMLYEPRVSANTMLYDTIPADIIYAGSSGATAPVQTVGMVRWNLGTIMNEGGSYTWWGEVAGCDHILNQAAIDGDDPVLPVLSNETDLEIYCGTYTVTPTITVTSTPTITSTVTVTITSTPTSTITLTMTQTNTPTITPTVTPTNTPTDTYTDTSTYTPTYTPTDTNTPTDTFTDTPSATFTDTPTDTDTFTPTFTFTDTNTDTPTNTVTDTFTFTDTPTSTFTPTDTLDIPTYTPTDTFTFTNTFTATDTYTDTFTPTSTSTFTDTFTPTDTFTYTNTPTDTIPSTPLPTNTPTYTHTFTDTFTFTYTNTSTNTFTDTPTYTYTFTATYSSTSTSTQTSTPTVTVTCTYSVTPTNTTSPTVTMTPPPFPYVLNISLYNEAGERVKTIANTRTSDLMDIVRLMAGGTESDVVSNTSGLQIVMEGIETPYSVGNGSTAFDFLALNDSGQPISNGPYYIKFTQIDEYGHAVVLIKDVQVIQQHDYVELRIYNAAGEKVRTIRKETTEEHDRIALKIDDMIVIENERADIKLYYTYNQSASISWDGLNEQGRAVSSGTYEMQVVVVSSMGKFIEASKTVIILNEGKQYLGNVKVYPNPVKRSVHQDMIFSWDGVAFGKLKISIFSSSGELVKKVFCRIEEGSLKWDMRSVTGEMVASGVYIAVIETLSDDGYMERKSIKAAIF